MESTSEALFFFVAFGKALGYFPVSLKRSGTLKWFFKWTSLQAIYSLTILAVLTVNYAFRIYRLYESEITFRSCGKHNRLAVALPGSGDFSYAHPDRSQHRTGVLFLRPGDALAAADGRMDFDRRKDRGASKSPPAESGRRLLHARKFR